MTSRSRGEGVTQSETNSTDRLRECVTKGGEGSKNPKNLRDVIYGWSLNKVKILECILKIKQPS